MELSELTAYAGETYRMREEHKWTDFPGFSVLCHPQTGKWVALLMRQWDGERGEEIQRCDMKCGRDSLRRFPRRYLSPPVRMHGDQWIDIVFDETTEPDVVFRLLDQAVALGTRHGYTMVLPPRTPAPEGGYRDTALPFAGVAGRPEKEPIPERLREMRRMFSYVRESPESRARRFYRQAVFMEDYEDEYPWTGDLVRYFPTYQDLTVRQLRGYFSWRARLRRGEFQPIASSAAYLYVYELLNGVGADSPEDGLEKLLAFERGYLDAGIGDQRMRPNLRRWMLEYAVLHDLPPERARQAADQAALRRDEALSVLRAPESRSDEEVFRALCFFGGKRAERSPVLAKDPEWGKRLFREAWQTALAGFRQETDLFTLCFGQAQTRPWRPLSNALYHRRTKPRDRDYALDDCRTFRCRNGVWQTTAWETPSFDLSRLKGFLHETDARLRRRLKTGRYLKENPADAWAIPWIDAAVEADRRRRLEAARPKISLDLSGLERIRRDAAETRESLLTQEEREESGQAEAAAPTETADAAGEGPLDRVQLQILRALLEGRDASELLRENRLTPAIAADAISEALFDDFGDAVVLCEGDRLLLAEDYTEDLQQYCSGD